ncbi:phosphatase PAP2 family protein [Hymenobacter sp. BT559]|uniref:phosphatase PAP2 family protein n=1 Tax=Hymenobacter sp. BT559 TaxID=2795729 RepID=UPI0018ECB7E6|nr:phosphatase PAP2 family protein [Hymenobacter sp. BT559]MBJ6142747.1 phosphatase PAP2 family protein [Hymenobacter sp. BT559]
MSLTRTFFTDLDHQLLLAINHAHTPALDRFMVFVSDRYVWFPAYALLILWLIDIFRRQAWQLLLLLIGAVALADSIASKLFKPFFARLRPCHAPGLMDQLHLPDGCGGQFGFLSSHAANSFALAVFLLLVLPGRRFRALQITAFLWAGLLSYSRMYLGAHYPSDVLGGALIGAALGIGATQLFRRWGGGSHVLR